MARSPETAVRVSVAPAGFASGGRPSRSKLNRRVAPLPAVGSGSGSDQSGVGPSTKRSTGACAGGGNVDHDARVRLSRLAMHGENGKAVRRAERHAARHAHIRPLDCRFLGAVAVSASVKSVSTGTHRSPQMA